MTVRDVDELVRLFRQNVLLHLLLFFHDYGFGYVSVSVCSMNGGCQEYACEMLVD